MRDGRWALIMFRFYSLMWDYPKHSGLSLYRAKKCSYSLMWDRVAQVTGLSESEVAAFLSPYVGSALPAVPGTPPRMISFLYKGIEIDTIDGSISSGFVISISYCIGIETSRGIRNVCLSWGLILCEEVWVFIFWLVLLCVDF